MKNICWTAVLSLSLAVSAWAGQSDLSQRADLSEMPPGSLLALAEAKVEESEADDHPLAAGKWVFWAYGSAAVGKSARKVYSGHLGVGYHIFDGFSVNLETVGHAIDQEDDASAVSLDLVPRWHYLRRENWSLYIDGGLGLIYSDERISESGTHFNFTSQAGIGGTYRLTDRLIPMGGLRWFHISNARIKSKERNVGFDSPQFYAGIMIPF